MKMSLMKSDTFTKLSFSCLSSHQTFVLAFLSLHFGQIRLSRGRRLVHSSCNVSAVAASHLISTWVTSGLGSSGSPRSVGKMETHVHVY